MNGNKKILIIGASGILGTNLTKYMSKYFRVYGTYNTNKKRDLIKLNIKKEKEVKQTIERINPDIIILSSYETNLDWCEENREEANKINYEGIKNVIDNSKNIKLIFYSSDAVFDGKKGDYKEESETNPMNNYGFNKLRCEKEITSKLKNYLIIRTSMLYGNNKKNKKFINFVIENLRNNKKIKVVKDSYISPTLIDDLSKATVKMIINDKKGIYHVVGDSQISYYNMAMVICETHDLNKKLIHPINHNDFIRSAPRGVNTSLNIDKLKKEGIEMSNFKEGISKIKNEI